MINGGNNIIKGRWADIQLSAELQEVEGSYDRINDFEPDSKGYFLIKIDPEDNNIRAGFCSLPENVMEKQVIGRTALEVINTIVREKLVSSLQHAGDLGIELCKAELALRDGLEYTQDGDLDIT